MRHPTSKVLFNYWDSLRGSRTAPDRGEIEPGAIRHILADTFILDLSAGEATFRLAGTRLCALFARELRGAGFTPLWMQDGRQDMDRCLAGIAADATGMIGGLVCHTSDGHRINLELILLPLRHLGRTHARMIGAISPGAIPVWIGEKPVVALETVSMRVITPVATEATPQPYLGAERRHRLVVYEGGRR